MNNKDKGSMEAASAEDLRQLRKSMETMQNQFFARIERRDSRLYDKLEEDREKNEEAYKELNNKNFDDIERTAQALDKHYITTRYPDALPNIAPHNAYNKQEAELAISQASNIINFVKKKIKED